MAPDVSSMETQELFVGEESRISPNAIDLATWLPSGVPLGFLPQDAQFPATFDRSVWPREDDLAERPPVGNSPTSNILGLNPLRPCMTNALGASVWRLCVSLISSRGFLVRSIREACRGNAIEYSENKPTEWKWIGYDVVDSGLATSGLLNLGTVGQDAAWKVLRRRAEKLTKYYLWSKIESAVEFAAELDGSVPPHAPFEVVGLYLCTSDQSK